MNRDSKFFSELKQLNEDLLNFLKEKSTKTPYYDYTPTLLDYVDQFKEIDKLYPAGAGVGVPTTTTTTTSTAATPNSIFNTTLAPSFNYATTNSTTGTAPLFNSTAPAFNASTLSFGNTSTANNAAPVTTGSSTGLPQLATATTTTTATTTATTNNFQFGAPLKTSAPTSMFSFNSALNQSSTQPSLFNFTMPPAPVPKPAEASSDPTGNKNDNGIANDEEDEPPKEPEIVKYEETDAKFSAKSKIYERTGSNFNPIGIGTIYIKGLDGPGKIQVIFRQEPDLKRVLLNEVATPQTPARLAPKSVQMAFSDSKGESKFYIAKFANDTDANDFHQWLTFAKT